MNGQVERMNRTLKEATVNATNTTATTSSGRISRSPGCLKHARQFKTLRGLTPCEHVHHVSTEEPERFRLHPSHDILGPSGR